ncbi:MAG: hypothetical protein FJX35_07255 [Alphaproteobacteria bacterium]|nr:hypothetical protein [Alphaproteobacteria bacterium]
MAYRCEIAKRPLEALFDLRGDAAAATACLEAIGLTAPTRPNSFVVSGDATAFWIGPRRWLLRAALAREAALAGEFARLLTSRLDGRLAWASLVSDMYAGFTVGGADVLDVLAQGSPLDLSPPRFAADASTMTELFGVAALVHADAAAQGFVIHVESSQAQFIERWLGSARGDRT